MFRVHTSIIRSTRCWVEAYGFLHRVLDGWWSWEPLRRSCVGCGWCSATARHHPHRTHDLRSGSQDHHPSKNSVQKTICFNSTSSSPDDGRMYPKHVELEYINKMSLLHQVAFSHYFKKKSFFFFKYAFCKTFTGTVRRGEVWCGVLWCDVMQYTACMLGINSNR